MQRVLITGANGFVGNHLAKELSANDIEVTGIGGQQAGSKKPENIDKYMVLDLNDQRAVEKIDLKEVTGIIHLAGLAAVGPSFGEPMNYINTNMGIEVNLYEAALKQNVRPLFLIISSGALYDPKTSLPLKEISKTLPNSPYSLSKLGQELVSSYYQTRGFHSIIARPFNHIGPGQNLGFIVPDLAKQIVEVEKGLSKNIFVGNLSAKRDYTDVRDIVRAYRLLLEKGSSGEVYNICSGKALSGTEVLSTLLSLSDSSPRVIKDSKKIRLSDSPVIYGSHEKITRKTGWKPEIDINKTFQDVLDDWRSLI